VDIDRLRVQWDASADTFDAEPDHGLSIPKVREAWLRLLRSLLPDPPARVADLGCGTGSVAILLAENQYDVVGVDFSARMIEHARAKVTANSRAAFHVGDASAPRLDEFTFDVVFARHVVWTLTDPVSALERWVRLLRPGGRLVLVEGLWHEGAGLRAERLVSLVLPLASQITVYPLPDAALWGREINDERYALVAIPDESESAIPQ